MQADRNAARIARLRKMKAMIEARLKPGDTVIRMEGRQDTFMGLFEHESDVMFGREGWYGRFEFTEARGHRTTANVKMPTILGYIGIDYKTLEPINSGADHAVRL